MLTLFKTKVMSEVKIDLYSYNRSKGIFEINGVETQDQDAWWAVVKNAIITQPGCKKIDNEYLLIYAVKS